MKYEFVNTVEDEVSKDDIKQLMDLVGKWIRKDLDSYVSKYGDPYCLLFLAEDQAIFLDKPENLSERLLTTDLILGVNNKKQLTMTLFNEDGESSDFNVGFFTDAKEERYKQEVVLPVSQTLDEEMIDDLTNKNGIKTTLRKSNATNADEFLAEIE